MHYRYFDRDLSWLSFNERILLEAQKEALPLLERLNFLSIYSSNLDEFYRVRMPAVLALNRLEDKKAFGTSDGADLPQPAGPSLPLTAQIRMTIDEQQARYGKILTEQILPKMDEQQVCFLYNRPIPDRLKQKAAAYFYEQLAAFVQPVWIHLKDDEAEGEAAGAGVRLKGNGKGLKGKTAGFFPENNRIYLAVFARRRPPAEDGKTRQEGEKEPAGDLMLGLVNIPSEERSRFYSLEEEGKQYILLIDDILKMQLPALLGQAAAQVEIEGCFSFKMTRDADIDYKDDYGKDVADYIERQLVLRDAGLATRLLYDSRISPQQLDLLTGVLGCQHAVLVAGGCYHNLKDLGGFPVKRPDWRYPAWPALPFRLPDFNDAAEGAAMQHRTIFDRIAARDQLISPPYHNYFTVLRFFNEAAICPEVEEIAVTLYRIAGDSQIAHALISAAKNGKRVTVFVELKARFDEANNLKWAKKMKAAGVRIVYSIWALKVHAKVALVKLRKGERLAYCGIFATGNFNENTARFYGDHILMTAHKGMLSELETLLLFLEKRARPATYLFFQPAYLLIAGFNLQQVFLDRIEACIVAAREGKAASMVIKLNNLEELRLIDKLYEASGAGVKIDLIVRSICRLVPGIAGMSENIRVRRLVGRYLEHSRVFIFRAGDAEKIYLGSADWMNRNIYRRIEVCFPVLDPAVCRQIKEMVDLQLADNTQAVRLGPDLENQPILRPPGTPALQAQSAIYQLLKEAAAAPGKATP